MAVAELTFPTTVSALLGDDDPDAVAGAMGERLPADGIAAQVLPGTRLPSRHLSAPGQPDPRGGGGDPPSDVAKPLVDWLAGFDQAAHSRHDHAHRSRAAGAHRGPRLRPGR